MWPYGTMTELARVTAGIDLAQSGSEQERAFLQQMLAIDEKARATDGVGIVIPVDGEPSWLRIGRGPESAAKALSAAVGNGTHQMTPLFKEISKTNIMGLDGCYLIHAAGGYNQPATGLRNWSRNMRSERAPSSRVPAIHGDAVFVHIVGALGWDFTGEYRFDDISEYDKNFPGDFRKYVRGNPNWWPRTPYKED